MAALVALVSATSLCPLVRQSPHPTLISSARRATVLRLAEDSESDPSPAEVWPAPAFSVEELQAKEEAAKQAAEAEALASPKPFIGEGGGFSVVALVTVIVFVAGGSLFFSGISGGGVARFADDSPEVQACIKQAATRQEASACLPPVPVE